MVAELDFLESDAEPAAPKPWRERPIIICDPVQFSRRLTIDVLRMAGAERITATETADAAIWMMRQARDPLLVADWRADGYDAAELVRRVRRETGAIRTAPSLVLSTRRALGDIENARDSGVSVVALRPISPKEVIDRLDQITNKPRPFVKVANYQGPDRRTRPDNADAFKRDADVAAGRTTPLRAAQAQARSIIFQMLRRGDPLAARVGRSMERYLSGVSDWTSRSREIVDLHRATLGQLRDLQAQPDDARLEVVVELEGLVRRRLRA